MDTDTLIELLDAGVDGLEEYVADNADELVDRLDEVNEDVAELVLENA